MQQRKLQDILRAMDAAPAFHEGWGTDREQFFRAQIDGVEPRPIAIAMPDCKVDIFAGEIDMMHRRRYPKIDLRVRIREMSKAVDQPLRGKVRRGTDGQSAGALSRYEPLGPEGDAVECVAHHGQILARVAS